MRTVSLFLMCWTAAVAHGGTVTTTLSLRHCEDDVEERGQSLNAFSTSLELLHDGTDLLTVGVRWRAADVPQGAKITDARLRVTSAVSSLGANTVNLGFEASDNSAPWTSQHPSLRSLTGRQEWKMSGMVQEGAVFESPNLASLLQPVVNFPTWASGNAMSLVITSTEGSATGVAAREVHSCDSESTGPVLVVTYEPSSESPSDAAGAPEDVVSEGTKAPATAAPATPAPPTAAPETAAPATAPSKTRVRKPFSALTCKERVRYAAAVNALKKQRPSDYDAFVNGHLRNAGYAHGTSVFLPWHRYFVLAYENALRSIKGFEDITVPYWDWEKDAGNEMNSSPMKSATFGDAANHPAFRRICVNSGVMQDWIGADGVCLNRAFNRWVRFSGEADLSAMVTTYSDYEDFAFTLEGRPHAAPHNFVGGHMSSMASPDDALFFIHHASVDRMWAVWQNYHGYNKVPSAELNRTHYAAVGNGRFDSSTMELDSVMPFEHAAGTTLSWLRAPVTPRDVHDMNNLPGGVSVSYGVDGVAQRLGEPERGFWDWVVPGNTEKLVCCGDGTRDAGEQCDDGNTENNDGCDATCRYGNGPSATSRTASVLSAPAPKKQDGGWFTNDVGFTDPAVRLLCGALKRENQQMEKGEFFRKCAKLECAVHYNTEPMATQEWIDMMGYHGKENNFLCGNF